MASDANIRAATAADLPELIDDLWLPLARKIAAVDDANALAADARKHILDYQRERLADEVPRIRWQIGQSASNRASTPIPVTYRISVMRGAVGEPAGRSMPLTAPLLRKSAHPGDGPAGTKT
jgi:hypothetical protein